MLSLTAAWVGQDTIDLVGPDGLGPDGYADIHIRLAGLDPGWAVARVAVQRYSAGAWVASQSASDNAAIVRAIDPVSGHWSTTADLYLEPYFDDPAGIHYELIRVEYASPRAPDVCDVVSTTPVSPNLRTRGDELAVDWLGQDGMDLAGPGPAVGADGVQDIHLRLNHLLQYARATDGSVMTFDPVQDSVVMTMKTTGGSTVSWLSGPRPSWLTGPYNNAEFLPDPANPSRADVYLNPIEGLVSEGPVTVRVTYHGLGRSDVSPNPSDPYAPPAAIVAAAPDPHLAAPPPPAPAYPVSFLGATAIWTRQDGAGAAVPGAVHVTVSGLPAGWSFAELTLSDDIGHVWTPGAGNPAASLTIGYLTDPTRADLTFPPRRDESLALMTLRYRLSGGAVQYVTQFHGGAADPNLRDPLPQEPSVTLDPAAVASAGGLGAVVGRYANIHLAAGTYPLDAPLVLPNPVTLTAAPGATLLFSQPASAPAWSYAIQVDRSHTTLDGLTVRFATPVRWACDFQMPAAVIGSSYGPDHSVAPKVDLKFQNLDLLCVPTAADLSGCGLCDVRLIRSGTDDCGVIAGNVLTGGPVEVWGGPWRLTGNDVWGAAAGSAISEVFAVHDGHDVLVADNHAHQVDPGGVTYRFLGLTGSASDTTVRNNRIDGGVGRDASLPSGSSNLPELIMTEQYRPHYEGPAIVGTDSRRLLRVPVLRGDPAQSGDLVAILSGPQAGRWMRVAQALDPHNYILDDDLPAGDSIISLTRGFIHEDYSDNIIDTTSLARSSSVGFQLKGAHADTTMRGNGVVGAIPFLIEASPTEASLPASSPAPASWGWSHLPILDVVVEGNTFIAPTYWVRDGSGAVVPGDAAARIGVGHGPFLRESPGRTYLYGSLTDNRFIEAATAGESGDVTVLRVGDAPAPDDRELILTSIAGNTAVMTGGRVLIAVESGVVAGAAGPATLPLPPPPAVVAGISGTSLGQDGSDRVGQGAGAVPDGSQDLHLALVGLPPSLAIARVEVTPYGYGYYQYSDPQLTAGDPAVRPGAWRASLVRPSTGLTTFATTADLFVQPNRREDGRNHWDVQITYADGSSSSLSIWGVVVTDPDAPAGTSPGRLTAVARGQDGADLVGRSATVGPDGDQDVHLALCGLAADRAVVQVDVFPFGYGHDQYVAPNTPAPAGPGVPACNASLWRAAFVRGGTAPGSSATTADLYVASDRPESGIEPGSSPAISNHYDVVVTYADGSTASASAWGVVDHPGVPVPVVSVTSLGQDGTDRVAPTRLPGADGVQDLHLVLNGLRTDVALARVEAWSVGGPEWADQGTSGELAAAVARAATGPGTYAPIADLALAPAASFLGPDGKPIPRTLHVVVHYADGTAASPASVAGVVADPRLGMPAAKAPARVATTSPAPAAAVVVPSTAAVPRGPLALRPAPRAVTTRRPSKPAAVVRPVVVPVRVSPARTATRGRLTKPLFRTRGA